MLGLTEEYGGGTYPVRFAEQVTFNISYECTLTGQVKVYKGAQKSPLRGVFVLSRTIVCVMSDVCTVCAVR